MWFGKAIKKATAKVADYAKRGVEILNLNTESALRDVRSLDDDTLIAKNGSTRRSVASTVTGTATNIALAVACPPFAAAAVVNVWQLCVSATNRHRVKREIKYRKKTDPKFKELYKECDKPLRDIAVGCTIKATLTALSVGLVGFDHIADGYQHLAHHAATASQFATQNVADGAVVYASTPSGKSIVSAHDPSDTVGEDKDKDEYEKREDAFEKHHGYVAAVNKGVHTPFSVWGEQNAELVGHIDEGEPGRGDKGEIRGDSAWYQLGNMVEHGVSKIEIAYKVAAIGAFAEIAQPLSTFCEQAANKWFLRRDEAGARTYMERSKPETTSLMNKTEKQEQAKKETAVRDELGEKLRARRAAQGLAG